VYTNDVKPTDIN
jgi:hypothetical protein